MIGTNFSECRQYRYTLEREWGGMFVAEPRFAMWIGLNPSTADETLDDPTIRRIIGFSKAWGYDGILMTNLFAFRATQPKDMLAALDPIGPQNDHWLKTCAEKAAVVIAAWGNHGSYRGRDKEVLKLIPNLKCLRITGGGSPSHPLYLPAGLSPVDYQLENS